MGKSSIPVKYEKIWRAVGRIPPGRVCTYGVVARLAGLDGQPRLAGYALHALPEGMDVPWHRVVNAGGRISLPSRRPSARRQRELLLAEGVCFTGEKIDLKIYGWPTGAFG